MTWVKSRLVRPDGVPVVGQCVTATLRTRPAWLGNRSGRILGSARTNTDTTGLWRLDLLPYSDFEIGEYAFYEINEGREASLSYIRVPAAQGSGQEYWLRDLLIGPPLPPDPNWSPITTLGRLHNVDSGADTAPAGLVLGSQSGGWVPVPFTLASLGDIDHDSVAAAQPGDQLVMLPSGRWGVFAGPFELAVEWEADDTYATGVWVTVYGSSTLGARVHWGDGTPATDVMPDVPVRHVYPPGGASYQLVARDKAYPLVRGEATIVISQEPGM